MRLLFSSSAGLGHLLPMLPLATAARVAGHEVVMATSQVHADRIETAGLQFRALAQPPELRPDEGPQDPGHRAGQNFARRNPLAALPDLLSIIDDWAPQFLVVESGEFAGGWAAEQTGMPWLRVHPGAVLDHAWERLSAAIASASRIEIGLPPDPEARRQIEAPQLCYFPAEFDTVVTDSVSVGRVLRVRAGERPQVGTRTGPVYITFGTEIPGLPMFAPLVRAAAAAVRAVDRTGILAMHRRFADAADEEFGDLSGLRIEPWVEQASVLAQAPAVICHGGAGTVLAALNAATPIVAVPFFADQPYNADRLVATDTGRRVDPGPELETRLGDALTQALSGEIAGGPAMAEAIADLPDLTAAVRWIEELASAADVTGR